MTLQDPSNRYSVWLTTEAAKDPERAGVILSGCGLKDAHYDEHHQCFYGTLLDPQDFFAVQGHALVHAVLPENWDQRAPGPQEEPDLPEPLDRYGDL